MDDDRFITIAGTVLFFGYIGLLLWLFFATGI